VVVFLYDVLKPVSRSRFACGACRLLVAVQRNKVKVMEAMAYGVPESRKASKTGPAKSAVLLASSAERLRIPDAARRLIEEIYSPRRGFDNIVAIHWQLIVAAPGSIPHATLWFGIDEPDVVAHRSLARFAGRCQRCVGIFLSSLLDGGGYRNAHVNIRRLQTLPDAEFKTATQIFTWLSTREQQQH
jgi:hypothetical protein